MTRPLVGASALGIAQAAYEWTLEYLDGQSEGGAPLLQTQRVQQTLADVATEIEAARLLVQRAAWMGRNGVPMTGGQGSMSKLKAGDVTMWATTTLMDLVGPDAWNTDYPLEKFFRDAKIYQLFEGTAEIQRMVISRMQAREYAERLGFGAEVAAKAMAEPRGRRVARSRGSLPGRKLREGTRTATPARAQHGHSHALDARREDSRRRMWIALAINVALLAGRGGRRHPHRLAGGARRRRPPALRRRLDRPGADRGPARLAAGPRPAHLRLPALRGAGGAGQRPAAGRGQRRHRRAAIGRLSDPPAIDGAGVLALGALGLAGNLAATWVLARGQREDINLEGVLRHSFADALGSLGVVLAGAFVLPAAPTSSTRSSAC